MKKLGMAVMATLVATAMLSLLVPFVGADGVDVTVTIKKIGIYVTTSNGDNAFDYGFLDAGATDNTYGDENTGYCMFWIQNVGNINQDFLATGADATSSTGTLQLENTVGTDQYVHRRSDASTSNTTAPTAFDDNLVDGVAFVIDGATTVAPSKGPNAAVDNWRYFDLEITLPSAGQITFDYTEQFSTTVVITAQES